MEKLVKLVVGWNLRGYKSSKQTSKPKMDTRLGLSMPIIKYYKTLCLMFCCIPESYFFTFHFISCIWVPPSVNVYAKVRHNLNISTCFIPKFLNIIISLESRYRQKVYSWNLRPKYLKWKLAFSKLNKSL